METDFQEVVFVILFCYRWLTHSQSLSSFCYRHAFTLARTVWVALRPVKPSSAYFGAEGAQSLYPLFWQYPCDQRMWGHEFFFIGLFMISFYVLASFWSWRYHSKQNSHLQTQLQLGIAALIIFLLSTCDFDIDLRTILVNVSFFRSYSFSC